MKNKMIFITAMMIFAACALLFVACGAEQPEKASYQVIYDEGFFENVKDSYHAGETVTVYFPCIATDTDYTFYLNGERFSNYTYDDQKGYVFTFTMPAQDVTLTWESKNSMVSPFDGLNDSAPTTQAP